MKRIKEYYIGKPCVMNIGADGKIVWATGRITGEAPGATKELTLTVAGGAPSIITFTTPHGSTFESNFKEVYEITEFESILKRYEKEAKELGAWYGNRLDNVSHDTMNLE